MKKRVIAVAMVGSVLGAVGPVAMNAVTSGAHAATCPAPSSGTTVATVGPVTVYDSGTPGSSTGGFVGVSGSGGGFSGYAEANGNAGPPPSGYVVADGSGGGQSGGAVVSSTPGASGQC